MVANRYSLQSMERIRQLIDERCGGSQQVFADRVDINKASVSQYVNGHNAPTNLTAGKIAKAFGVNPAWVMGFDVPITATQHQQTKYQTIIELLDMADDNQLKQIEKIIKAIVEEVI